MIYFIQDQSTCYIKLGFTTDDAARRLKELQTGCPSGLVLLGTIPGDRPIERELHGRFREARVHGEWFKPVPDLLQFILQKVVQHQTPVPNLALTVDDREKVTVILSHTFYCGSLLNKSSILQGVLEALNVLTGNQIEWDEEKFQESLEKNREDRLEFWDADQ